jgi:methionine synthase I (cobalamin-dependent)
MLHARTTVLVVQGPIESALADEGFEGYLPLLNLTEPETVEELHKRFRAAGADVAVANTRGADPAGLAAENLSPHGAQINAEGVRLARAAGFAHVLGAVAPCGANPEPYAQQVAELAAAAPDGVLLGGFSQLDEALAALEGARRAAADLPALVTLTFAADADPAGCAEAASRLVEAGAAAVGCADMPTDAAAAALEAMSSAVDVPLVALACAPAGAAPDAYANLAVRLLRAGARVLGAGRGASVACTGALYATVGGVPIP